MPECCKVMKYNDDIALDNYIDFSTSGLRWPRMFFKFSGFQTIKISAGHLSEKMETIYLILEKAILWSGDTESLQDFRSWMLRRTTEFDGYPATELISSLLMCDSKLRHITQLEECLLEQVQDLAGKETTSLEKQRLQDLQRQLEGLRKNYWKLEYGWLESRDRLKGPVLRGFIECRSNLRWYLSDTLRRRCAELGGCCGRGCQCCENRSTHINSARKVGVGHCTFDCGCCSKARGFDFTSKEKTDLYAKRLRLGRCIDCPLCVRMVSASFWGSEYEEFRLLRKWKWWLSKRIAFMGFTILLLYYIGRYFT
jgi:hypothetical protein